MAVAGGVIIFFLVFLLPRLKTLLSSLGGKMPKSTSILINFSEFALSVYGLVTLAAVVFGIIVMVNG